MFGVCTANSTLMMMGIIVEASAVALAKPRWMTIKKQRQQHQDDEGAGVLQTGSG